MEKRFTYLVGALLLKDVTPEKEQEKLTFCGEQGYELVSVITKKQNGADYVFFYFKKIIQEGQKDMRFDPKLVGFEN